MNTIRNYWPQIVLGVITILELALSGHEFFLRPDVVYDIYPGYELSWIVEQAGITMLAPFVVGVEISNQGIASAEGVDIHIKDLSVPIRAFKVETDRFVIVCGSEEDPQHGGPGYHFLKCSQPDLVPGHPTVIVLALNRRDALDQDNVAVTFKGLFGSARFAKGGLPWWRRISRLTPYFLAFWVGWIGHWMWVGWYRGSKIPPAGQGHG